jgi:hypothetical protein
MKIDKYSFCKHKMILFQLNRKTFTSFQNSSSDNYEDCNTKHVASLLATNMIGTKMIII